MFFTSEIADFVVGIIRAIFPSWILQHPFDYVLHFGISLLGVLALYYAFMWVKLPHMTSLWIAIGIFIVLGVYKEILDTHVSVFSIPDLIADGLGIALAVFLIYIFSSSSP